MSDEYIFFLFFFYFLFLFCVSVDACRNFLDKNLLVQNLEETYQTSWCTYTPKSAEWLIVQKLLLICKFHQKK